MRNSDKFYDLLYANCQLNQLSLVFILHLFNCVFTLCEVVKTDLIIQYNVFEGIGEPACTFDDNQIPKSVSRSSRKEWDISSFLSLSGVLKVKQSQPKLTAIV